MSTSNLEPAIIGVSDCADCLPTLGSRVWITGFPRDEHDELVGLVERAGYVPTPFATGASAILAPFPPSPSLLQDAERAGRQVLSPASFRETDRERPRRTAIEVDDETVRILDVTLPRRAAGTTRLLPDERFANLCLDATFLAAARTVAIAARHRLPCVLEGDTAVSKTTAVLWVAHLCRQESVRLNLNGQSDTGELVGRYVPGTVTGEASWRFWEGIVPDAMRHGRWVVLDELNLAEPQVLERLNPVLEQHPSLILSEHLGERFGCGGDVPLADDFSIFGTMNPSEFAGRSVLSPAFRDRWSVWQILEAPGEIEYRALLTRLVHGSHPSFVLDGIEWQAPDSAPIHPALANEPGIDGLLDRIAAFHTSVSSAASELGRSRRERYVFTRRTMLATMTLLAAAVSRGARVEAAARQAIEISYLQRVQPGADRQALRTAVRSAGLSR
jgi:MoxR-like ATPase